MNDDNDQAGYFQDERIRDEFPGLVARHDHLVRALQQTEDPAMRADLAQELRRVSQQIAELTSPSEPGDGDEVDERSATVIDFESRIASSESNDHFGAVTTTFAAGADSPASGMPDAVLDALLDDGDRQPTRDLSRDVTSNIAPDITPNITSDVAPGPRVTGEVDAEAAAAAVAAAEGPVDGKAERYDGAGSQEHPPAEEIHRAFATGTALPSASDFAPSQNGNGSGHHTEPTPQPVDDAPTEIDLNAPGEFDIEPQVPTDASYDDGLAARVEPPATAEPDPVSDEQPALMAEVEQATDDPETRINTSEVDPPGHRSDEPQQAEAEPFFEKYFETIRPEDRRPMMPPSLIGQPIGQSGLAAPTLSNGNGSLSRGGHDASQDRNRVEQQPQHRHALPEPTLQKSTLHEPSSTEASGSEPVDYGQPNADGHDGADRAPGRSTPEGTIAEMNASDSNLPDVNLPTDAPGADRSTHDGTYQSTYDELVQAADPPNERFDDASYPGDSVGGLDGSGHADIDPQNDPYAEPGYAQSDYQNPEYQSPDYDNREYTPDYAYDGPLEQPADDALEAERERVAQEQVEREVAAAAAAVQAQPDLGGERPNHDPMRTAQVDLSANERQPFAPERVAPGPEGAGPLVATPQYARPNVGSSDDDEAAMAERPGFNRPSGMVLAVVGVCLALLAGLLWFGGPDAADETAVESAEPAAPTSVGGEESADPGLVIDNVRAVLDGLGLTSVVVDHRDGVIHVGGPVPSQADYDAAANAARAVSAGFPVDTSALVPMAEASSGQAQPADGSGRPEALQSELNRILAGTPLIFASGQAEISELHQRILNNVVLTLSAYPGFSLTIAGYTDELGDNTSNEGLSLSRAESVRQYLISQGLPADALNVRARGEETATGSAGLAGLERRVEFEVEGTAAPVDESVLRVAIVAPSASNDLAFTQSMVDAVNRLATETSIELAVTDNTFVPDEAAAAVQGYAEQGFDLVIAHGSQFGASLIDIAPQYPDTAFAWGTAADTFGLPNVYAYDAAAQEGGYVLGAIASLLSSNDVVGVVGPIEVGDAALYVNGFQAGARDQESATNVLVSYTGSFSDIGLATETAQNHIGAGADVLTGSAQMVVGAVAAAEQAGAFWFGTQSNQASLAPQTVVASQVYRWEVAIRPIIDDIRAGQLAGTTYTASLANGGLTIEYNPEVPLAPEVRQRADEIFAGIANGSIVPPK